MFRIQFHNSNMKATFLVALSVLALAHQISGQACPTIVTRAQWGARAANTAALTTFPPTHVVIHHSATQGCTTQAECAALVRSFQNFHMDAKGWGDIGYNFVVGGDGLVYQGRGWGRTGAHAVSFNARSIGIAFAGTFTTGLPPAASLNAAHALIACGRSQGLIARSYRLIGHRQASVTACPGNALFNHIRGWLNFVTTP